MPQPDTTPTETVTLPEPLTRGEVEVLIDSGRTRDVVAWRRLNESAKAKLRAALDGEVPGEAEVLREKLLGGEAVDAGLKAAREVSFDATRDQLADEPTGHPSQHDVVRAAFKAGLAVASSESPRGEGR
jgi:hypothetical protein